MFVYIYTGLPHLIALPCDTATCTHTHVHTYTYCIYQYELILIHTSMLWLRIYTPVFHMLQPCRVARPPTHTHVHTKKYIVYININILDTHVYVYMFECMFICLYVCKHIHQSSACNSPAVWHRHLHTHTPAYKDIYCICQHKRILIHTCMCICLSAYTLVFHV